MHLQLLESNYSMIMPSLGCNHTKVTKSLNLMGQKDQTEEKEWNDLDYLGPSHVDNL